MIAQPEGISIAFSSDVFSANPVWVRLDTSYAVTGYQIRRGRSYELDKVTTGTATINIVDINGDFDPTNATSPISPATMIPTKFAAIALQNPVDDSWNTIFSGFVSSWEWDPNVSLTVANCTIHLEDALGVLAAMEMTPDGTWGDSQSQGNIVFDEDLATTAVQTRITKQLDDSGWPANVNGSDGVTNGTTTFTAASGSFTANDVGKFIVIQTKGRFQIMARASATSITLSATATAGTSLAWTYGTRSIFSGNTKLWETTYSPRSQALNVILDASDAEFPFGVASFYVDKNGIITFHGRRARFFPNDVDYHISQWVAGDAAALAADPGNVIPLSPPLTLIRDSSSVFTDAIATSSSTDDGDIAGQYCSNAATSTLGRRTWSAEGLATAGSAPSNTANQATKIFAQWVVDTYYDPTQTRLGSVTVVSQPPAGVSGTVTWDFLCNVDLSDQITITTTHGGGGGLAAVTFFVEGITYNALPMNADYPYISLTLDVSPAEYYSSYPF